MNSAWKKLWPECAPDRDFNGFDADSGSARHSHFIYIYGNDTIGQGVGMEVDIVDIEERLEDHSIELTTEELEHHMNEQEKELAVKFTKKRRIRKMSKVL